LSLADLDDTGASGTDFVTQDRDFDLAIAGQENGAAVTYQVSVNGGPWTSTTTTQRNLADASYAFRATVTDTAGALLSVSPLVRPMVKASAGISANPAGTLLPTVTVAEVEFTVPALLLTRTQ
jgi:hypothetical protein